MEPQAIHFEPSDFVPNNPNFPVLLYRHVLTGGDRAAAFEALFEGNGWGGLWRNGVYAFHHFHSRAHEVLGFAEGSAQLLIGGPTGARIEVQAGDVAILPAGTGHCRLSASEDFLVVGGYPPGHVYDLCREEATAMQLKCIHALRAPLTDPVTGTSGGLVALWL